MHELKMLPRFHQIEHPALVGAQRVGRAQRRLAPVAEVVFSKGPQIAHFEVARRLIRGPLLAAGCELTPDLDTDGGS